MSRFFYLFAALICGISASAQTTVRGTVKDAERGEAVGYATVAATRDSLVLAATASTAQGAFTLNIKEEGACKIEISAVGYTPFVTELSADGTTHDLGEIVLKAGVEVDAVVLTVQKPIVTSDAEKLAYSVEDDPEAQSSTLEEIIRKVPQLSIDAEGNVLMNGQSDYKILVNGHESSSMSRNFKELIKSMPAASIKRIEVITNPSMKYDAEGTGGVLNIITTKSRFDGYNGNVNLSAGNWFNRNWNTNNSANFTFQTEKFAISAGFYYSQGWSDNDTAHTSESNIENLTANDSYRFMNELQDVGYRYHSLYGDINASYQIDSLNLLTAEVSSWGGRQASKYIGTTEYLDDSRNPIYSYISQENSSPNWIGVDASVNYEHTFNREGHTLTISDNISVSPTTTNPSTEHYIPTLGTVIPEYTLFKQRSEKSFYNTTQIDYNNRINEHHAIEAGAKYVYDNSRQLSLNEGYGLHSEGSTQLTKNIFGLYAGYTYTAGKISGRAGGRLEGAWYNVDDTTDGNRRKFDNKLLNIVPYLSITCNPATGHSLSLAYTERLRRPGIWQMSPFVTQSNSTLDYGNPNLRTGLMHSLSLKYAYAANKWSASFEARTMLSNNNISQYIFIDDDGFINLTYRNNAHIRLYAGDISLSYRPSSKFNLSASVRGGWYDNMIDDIRVCGWTFSESINATIALWKGARLSLSESVIHPESEVVFKIRNQIFATSVRLGQKLLKDKLEIALSVNNPHAKNVIYKGISQAPTYNISIKGINVQRSIRLAITYRFGKQGLSVRSTNKKLDDGGDNLSSGKGQM